jgi:uncharacterized NAD(P)/FAD-binding protein YdhS
MVPFARLPTTGETVVTHSGQRKRLSTRGSARRALVLGTFLTMLGLVVTADAHHPATVWWVCGATGIALVALSLPCYLHARLRRGP